MSESSDGDLAQGIALYGGYDFAKGVRDIAAVVDVIHNLPGASGKVGITGYCLGGLMTYLSAARRVAADAFVAYYGGDTDKYVTEAGNIKAPLLYHLAGEDEWISKEAQAAINAALKDKANVVVYNYPTNNHAFARPGGTHYDIVSADLANLRTAEFFKRYLS